MAKIDEIRKQYPQYGDMSDRQIARALHDKHYADMDFADFFQRFTGEAMGESGPSPELARAALSLPSDTEVAAGQETLGDVLSGLFLGTGKNPQEIEEFEGGEDSVQNIEAALRLFPTVTDEQQRAVIQETFPEADIVPSEQGFVIQLPGQEPKLLNKPGASMRDLTTFINQVATYAPSAKFAQGAKTALGRMARALTGGTATSMGADVASGVAAGEQADEAVQGVSPVRAAFAGGAEAGGQVLAEGARKAAPPLMRFFRRLKSGRTEMSPEFRQGLQEIAETSRESPIPLGDDEIKAIMARSGFTVADDAGTEDILVEAGRKAAEAARGGANAEKAAREAGRAMLRRSQRLQREFPEIPYTKGERTGDPTQLAFEERALKGSFGEAPERIMQGQRAQSLGGQQREVARQRRRLGSGSAPDIPAALDEPVARLRQAAATEREAAGEAFEKVGDATLSGQGVEKMRRSLLGRAKADDFVVDSDLAPATVRAVKAIEDSLPVPKMREGKVINPSTGRPMTYKQEVSTSIKNINTLRRKLDSLYKAAPNAQDKAQINILRNEIYDQLDQVTKDALIAGDTDVIDNLKKANELWSEYKSRFFQQDKSRQGVKLTDSAGREIEKFVVDPELSGADMANVLFNSSSISPKMSSRMVTRLKDVLGANSPEFGKIKEAVFMKLAGITDGTAEVSARKFKKRLRDATTGPQKQAMMGLFGPQEIQRMMRLGDALERAQPPSINPSGTGFLVERRLSEMVQRLPFLSGDPAGMALGALARGGKDAARQRVTLRGVKQAVEDYRPIAEYRLRISEKPTQYSGAAGSVLPAMQIEQEGQSPRARAGQTGR